MIADPPDRKDGLCAQCGKPRKMPKHHHRSIDPAVYAADPFCSGSCCRAWYGIALTTVLLGDPNEKRGRHERAAA